MQGLLELEPSVPLKSRHRPAGQKPFLARIPSATTSSSSLALLRSVVGEKRILFRIFVRQPATPVHQDPRFVRPYRSIWFFISSK